MNEEVTKLFDRSFLVGFYAPALYLVIASMLLLLYFSVTLPGVSITASGLQPGVPKAGSEVPKTEHEGASPEPLKNATLIAGIAMGLAIFLMSLNREIFRLAEGYWHPRLQRLFLRWELKRFQSVNARVEALRAEKKTNKAEQKPFVHESELSELWQKLVTEFPDETRSLLPTRFGNAVRSFEVYSRVMYGIDSIPAWPRLQAVIPDAFSNLITESRARVNFWLNIWAVSLVLLSEWALLECRHPSLPGSWLFGGLLVVLAFSLRRATSSARQHGEQVKAAFDVYLPELARKILDGPLGTNEQAQQFWTSYSQALIFRHTKSLATIEELRRQLARASAMVSDARTAGSTGNPGQGDDFTTPSI